MHIEVSVISRMVNDYFFFNDTATTEIYTLSLHDALPILVATEGVLSAVQAAETGQRGYLLTRQPDYLQPYEAGRTASDRKSTRLNSSHANISYAVFCLKKKTNFYIYLPTRTLPLLYHVLH